MSADDSSAEKRGGAESVDAFDSIEAFGAAVGHVLGGSAPPRLQGPLIPVTGRCFAPALSPRLSYGRHRGPARLDSRRAAVAIVVYPHRPTGRLCLTLTRRPKALSHHGGQICLPGGQIEPGESPLEAALREYREELGVSPQVIQVVGRLKPIYVFASDNLVETLVLTAGGPIGDWNPDPVEVDEVIEMPLESVVQLGGGAVASSCPPCKIITEKRDRIGKKQGTGEVFQYRFGHPAIEFSDFLGRRRVVWGATAMLLGELADAVCLAIDDRAG
ncbi:putative NUDIX hydrolase [Stieleria maiorica]|uniref:Putative NUDIX hydrolase n=1 Tax=Stieleria maiorica TaxID=2795974 RepID=A0A5B9MIC7_9BACT|nr:CoA pyrophosphatase [Stieleria maiorica]QEG00664.1 putative NUDIX hydrolase [Stieleria maiorica]